MRVEASFWTSKFPPSILNFVYQVLWKKLKVGDRLKFWTQQPNCPVCHRLETVEHAVQSCALHPLIHDPIDKCWEIPPNAQAVKSVESLPQAKSLQHPAGVMLWVARAAHWSVRHTDLHEAVVTYDLFLDTWIKLVALVAIWEPLAKFSQAILEFYHALQALKLNGVLVHTKIQVAAPQEPSRPQKKQK